MVFCASSGASFGACFGVGTSSAGCPIGYRPWWACFSMSRVLSLSSPKGLKEEATWVWLLANDVVDRFIM